MGYEMRRTYVPSTGSSPCVRMRSFTSSIGVSTGPGTQTKMSNLVWMILYIIE